MVRTALKDSPTKRRLLDAAQQLMLANGFGATTLEEMCDKAQVTKGGFFHYFDSKEALGKELLQRFCAQGQQLHASFCGREQDPLKRVFNYIDGAAAIAKDPVLSKGCLLGTFAQELSDSMPGIRQVCAKGFCEWKEQFAKELALAKARYAPRASFRPEELAEHLIVILEGSLILGKAQRDRRVVERNLKHFTRYLKTLFGTKEK